MDDLFGESQSPGLSLRYYQQDAINSAYHYLRERTDNPCIVLPTGAGKTPVMATICYDAVKRWGGRVLVLSHVKELIQQTSNTMRDWFPELNIGVYSAGIGRRDTRSDVLIAGVQSVYRRGLQLAGARPFNLVLVDECHRIPTSGDGMYQTILSDLKIASPTLRVIGLTATPYRLQGGYVCGPEHFLNEICHETGVRELIAKGFLCPLKSKQSDGSVDQASLGVRNGEFKSEDLSAAFDVDSVVSAACEEIVDLAKNRKSVIIFCCNVQHATHVRDQIESLTQQACGLVTGKTPRAERDQAITSFKLGETRFLVNVSVLCEGFDARQVDCVVLLRSTLSPGLFYQMVGRGLRTHEHKSDCLVLDFGGNIVRHGCIDAIKVPSAKKSKGTSEEMQGKACPECKEVIAVAFLRCPECGHEFPEREERVANHRPVAEDAPITSDQIKTTHWEVTDTHYSLHVKRGAAEDAPRSMRVSYYNGVTCIADEWVCLEHDGFAYEKAVDWWSNRCSVEMPQEVEEAVALGNQGFLAKTSAIEVLKPPGERFARITKYELGEVPDPESIELTVDEWGETVRADSNSNVYGGNDQEDWVDVPF